jgi:hypothetical protein
MKAPKLIAIAAAVVGVVAIPTIATAGQATDSYTVTLNPIAAQPGDHVQVTATDSATQGFQCGNAPYTVSIAYTKVGGTEASAQVGEGLTDSDDAHVSTEITVPSDAASSDASGVNASVSVAVTCGTTPTARPGSASPNDFTPQSTPAALTITPFDGSIKLSPTFAFRGTDEDVTLTNCQGGPISALFTSYGHEKTAIDVTNYDAGAATAAGSFTVADDTTYGPGAITGSCWQTSYSAKKLFVGNAEEEVGHGVAGGAGGTHVENHGGVAKHAHAVAAQPTFTG